MPTTAITAEVQTHRLCPVDTKKFWAEGVSGVGSSVLLESIQDEAQPEKNRKKNQCWGIICLWSY